MKDLSAHQRYAFVLGAIFLMIWITLAIEPVDRKDWALENALAVIAVIALVVTARRFPLSRISWDIFFRLMSPCRPRCYSS